jgi:putative glutamine amidotransferase
MDMKPKILIAGDGGDCQNYVNAVLSAGGQPVVAYCPQFSLDYDGLLLTGGGDIEPALYAPSNDGSESIDYDRDLAELELLGAFLALRKPVMGVCRGHQVINVGLGGTLRQHIGDDLCRFHRHTSEHNGDKVHSVYSADGSWYRNTYGDVFSVNSSHHQALNQLGGGLRPVLWSESGIVEAVEHDSLLIVSVQFHPERMTGINTRPDTVDGGAIFARFLELCQKA